MIAPSPRCPKTWSVVVALLRARGHTIPPGAWQIPTLNLPKADLPALTEAIGPGWRFTVQHLAYGRVKVTIASPSFCPVRPAKRACEHGPEASPHALWAALGTMASIGWTARSRR